MTSSNIDATGTGFPPGLAGEVEAIRRRIGDLDAGLWAARTPGELVETVAALEALKSTLTRFELGLLAHLDATKAVQPLGWASTRDFATTVSGGHRREGATMVRQAIALESDRFAPVAEALGDGWLSPTKAAVIVSAVDRLPGTADHVRAVAVMLAEAKRLDASDLARVGRHLVTVVDPEGEDRREERALAREERAAHHGRFLSVVEDQAGGARISGRCAAEDAAMIRTTLMSLAAPHPTATPTCEAGSCREPGCRHDGSDPRDHGARFLDALVQACGMLQTTRVLPDQHGATPRIGVMIPLAELTAGLGTAVAEDGTTLSATAIRRLACDAELIPLVLGSAGEVLDVGRGQRLATPALWRAVVARDRHCRFPGCTRPPAMCQAHHVWHWADGGPTRLENLILLCGHHHRLVHHTPWEIHTEPDGRHRFVPPRGVARAPLTPPRPPPLE